jgi:tetratricopeptide (TPR) repeat protein
MPPFIPWVEIVEEAVRTRPRAVFRSALGDTAPEVAKIVPELRQLFLDIPPAIELPPEQHRRYLFNSFLSFLERAASSTTHVLLIDDLHWADESTLSLLRHIAQRIAQVPMLIVATYRDDELDSTRPFAKTLEALMRQRLAHRFPLHRLAEDGVRNMLTALSNQDVPDAVVRTLFRATEGNPFFVEEMFHDLVEEGLLFGGGGQWRTALQTDSIDVPESIRLVISRRAERLNGAARRILATIAVIGRSFDLALLSELCDSDLEQWLTGLEEAQAAKLVLSVAAGRDVRWEFAHGLIRQTLESQLPAARRQRAHLRIAEAMERAYSTRLERHASEIARHLYQAGAAAPEDKTTRFLILAGDLALEARAFDEALRQFDNALSIQDEQQVRSVAALRYKKGTALRSLGRGDEALEEWHRALATYEALGDVESIAHTLYDVVWETSWRPPGSAILRGLSPIQAAKSIAQRGLELVESGDAVHGRLLALMAVWSARAGDDFRTSLDLLQEAEALGARLQQPRLTMELLDARMHIHYAYMQLPQTVEIGRAAVGMRHERGELYDACDNYWAIMLASFTMGRLKEALDVSQTLEALATRVGHLPGRWNVRVVRTLVELVTSGDLVRSETMARADMEAAAVTNPVWRSFNHLTIGLMRFFAGDWPMARSEFDAAVRHDPKSFTDGVFPSAWLLAQTYAGDAEALGRLKESASSLITLTEENPHGVWERLQNVVEGLAVLRQARDAAALYPLVLKAIEKGAAISYGVRLWQMVAGIAAAAGGHIDAARAHFETALRQADELPHRIAQPEIRRWYGQMMLDTGADSDRDRARVLLAEALGMYQALGMPRHVEMAAAGLH